MFLGTEHFFKQIDRLETKSRILQMVINPTYKKVCTDTTSFAETVYIKYDETKMGQVLTGICILKAIDPVSCKQTSGDCGTQYRTGVYYTSEDQLPVIERSLTNSKRIS